MKRYFIVFYTTKAVIGNTTFTTENGVYLNRIKTNESIKNSINAEEVVVTNIIELSKQEFDNWTTEY